MTGKYDDMLRLPHHVSSRHPQMAPADRAAQFSPFAALTGFGAAIRETARQTESRRELDESEKAALNETLLRLQDCPPPRPAAAVTYFKPDERKEGGTYVTVTEPVRKLDPYELVLVLQSGAVIPIEDLYEIRFPV